MPALFKQYRNTFVQMAERWVRGVDWASAWAVAPGGAAVAAISRGVLFTAPVAAPGSGSTSRAAMLPIC